MHPNALRYGEPQESGRYLHYFRHWESFTLTLHDYRLTRVFASHTAHGLIDDPRFDAAADKLSNDGWETLSDDEKKAFEDAQLRKVTPVATPDGFVLEGWGELEGGTSRERITALAVEGAPGWGSKNEDGEYNKTFSRIRVSIVTAPEEVPGSMWVWDDEMQRSSRIADRIPADEDVLYAHFYMLPEKLKAIADEIALLPTRPSLLLDAQGLMFRDEVESALSEIWHPCDYVIIHGRATPVILNRLNFETVARVRAEVTVDDDWTVADEPEAPDAPSSMSEPKSIGNDLRALKHAVWLLAAAIVLAAIIH